MWNWTNFEIDGFKRTHSWRKTTGHVNCIQVKSISSNQSIKMQLLSEFQSTRAKIKTQKYSMELKGEINSQPERQRDSPFMQVSMTGYWLNGSHRKTLKPPKMTQNFPLLIPLSILLCLEFLPVNFFVRINNFINDFNQIKPKKISEDI